jgi:hypothetical protein
MSTVDRSVSGNSPYAAGEQPRGELLGRSDDARSQDAAAVDGQTSLQQDVPDLVSIASASPEDLGFRRKTDPDGTQVLFKEARGPTAAADMARLDERFTFRSVEQPGGAWATVVTDRSSGQPVGYVPNARMANGIDQLVDTPTAFSTLNVARQPQVSNIPAAAQMINLNRAVGVPGRPELGEVFLFKEVGPQGERFFAKARNGQHVLEADTMEGAVAEARNLLRHRGFSQPIYPVAPGATQIRPLDPNAPQPIRYDAGGFFNTNLRARAEASGFLVQSDGTIVGSNSFQGGVAFGELFTVPGFFREGAVPPTPANATPEFRLGLQAATQPLLWQKAIDLAQAGASVRTARGSVPASRVLQLNQQYEQTPHRVIQRFIGSRAGVNFDVNWRASGEAPQAWNRATQSNGTAFDCNWCSLEVVTGQSRQALKKFGVLPDTGLGEAVNYREVGAALKKLNLLSGRPQDVRIEGARSDVLAQMQRYQPGQYFMLTVHKPAYSVNNDDLGMGHTVVARRTGDGIEILDGQINRAYDAATDLTKPQSWYAYPISRPINPALQ